MSQEKLRTTLSGNPPAEGTDLSGAPQPIDPTTGMHRDYWVLPEEERLKGFVRPYRDRYQHIGASGPKGPLRELTPEEHERYDQFSYVKFEASLDKDSSVTGRYWTQKQLDSVGKGCRTVTTMGRVLSETYARDPQYYGSTFCCGCRTHLPVDEFVWSADDCRVGS